MAKKIITLALILSVVLSGCIQETPQPIADDSPKIPLNESIVANDALVISFNFVNANNQFALDFYSNLKNDEEGNIFFSPYSISTALAMTYEGARGQTSEEIQSVFYFTDNDITRRKSFALVHNKLNSPNVEYKLQTANALWAQRDYPFLDEYIETIESFYAGKVTNLDFKSKTEQSRQTINSWVENKTNDKIKDLFPEGSLNDYTRLVITNAIYFKGTWVKQFNETETKQDDFRISPKKVVQVPMMKLTGKDAKFNYSETGKLQILEMLYEGEDLSMIVLLPKNDDLKALEDSFTLEKLGQWKSEQIKQRVDVYLPKFTFDSKYFLNKDLKEMGMPSAFTPAADFSGMDGTKNLSIQSVIHQAFIDVNEEGTEATASTGVVFGVTSMPPPVPVFRADHPFIFMIQERGTGNILFLGRVVNPS